MTKRDNPKRAVSRIPEALELHSERQTQKTGVGYHKRERDMVENKRAAEKERKKRGKRGKRERERKTADLKKRRIK